MMWRYPSSPSFIVVVIPIHRVLEGITIDWIGSSAIFAIVKKSLLSDLLAIAASTFIPMVIKYGLKRYRSFQLQQSSKPRTWIAPASITPTRSLPAEATIRIRLPSNTLSAAQP
ncbi:hypothetical protein [Paenibacillus sp. 1001270B_150601_E10]|uniref:hypothetical protein n=1 Tax=Paenibacillus sp. 1001270B_150601_E10 TaxID=2787079 RepID=UPI00189FD365|nr:hypothetical protein [Paenibacillus sp. 1001270B_150601_E10]